MTRPVPDPKFWTLGDGPPPPGAFVALVPGAVAPLLPLDLPARLRGAARDRVARRQMADLLGQSPERFELRILMPPGGTARALVVDGELRSEWAQSLAGTGCTLLLPDYLALPAAEGLWTLKRDGDTLLARLGPHDGFACETALARVSLARALAAQPPKAVLHDGPLPDDIATPFSAANVPLYAAPGDLPATLAPRQLAHGEAALDLLRDPAARRADLKRSLGRWRAPVLLALLALLAWSASAWIETAALRDAARQHRETAETMAREVFLPNTPILDLRMQIAREVGARQNAADDSDTGRPPLELFRTAAPVLLSGGATVRRVAWRGASGLVIDLDVADFAALEGLVADLRDTGLAVRIAQSVAGEDAGVSATLGISDG